MEQTMDTGKIVTLYSFKGGVGRTMAVANLAFLAALNGKRVLVMDWDLEAPGLVYYFRGMVDAADSLAFDAAPGVLDILCQWCTEFEAAESEVEIDLLQQRMEVGSPFQACVRPLVQAKLAERLFPATACLDMIGPGARSIAALNHMPYEEALAQFSWQQFFEQQAGGFVLEKMRLWAKDHYDFIFIDSRTGLADIAGICTMQLPDIVALCFVLNQQNIDGVAKVAAAVHAHRKNEVVVRAVPMRVAQRDSAQESEAQARAASALTRIGGFDRAAVKSDMNELSIALVDDLPFYETLAPFVAKDPAFDPLTLSYLRLGRRLFEPELPIPEFNQTVIAEIKQRLQPRNATVEYLESLKSAAPERAFEELQKFTESAVATVMYGGTLEEAYVLALLDVGLYVVDLTEEAETNIALVSKILEIIRKLSNGEPEVWGNILRLAIERVLDGTYLLEKVHDELSLREELDAILALTPDITNRLKRLDNLYKASQVYLSGENSEKSNQKLNEIIVQMSSIIGEFKKNVENFSMVNKTNFMRLVIAHKLLTGQWLVLAKQEGAARLAFEEGLELLVANEKLDNSDGRLDGLSFEFHRLLANLAIMPALDAAEHAVAAMRFAGGAVARHNFFALARVVQRASDYPRVMLQFCELFFISKKRPHQFLTRQGYTTNDSQTIDFFEINIAFIKVFLTQNNGQAQGMVQTIVEILSAVLAEVLRRRGQRVETNMLRSSFNEKIMQLINIVEDSPLQIEDFPALLEAQTIIDSAGSLFNSPTDTE